MIWVVLAGVLANALRLRHRITGLRRLPVEPAETGRAAGAVTGYTALTAEDAEVAEPVLRDAAEYARRGGIGMLDLVPADLPVEQALDLVRTTDPRAYRKDRFGLGRGAGYAVLLEGDVVRRSRTEPHTGLDAGEMGEATARLRFYVESADLVVAPVHAADRIGQRRAWLRSLALSLPPSVALPQASYFAGLGYLLVLSGLLIDPLWGLGLLVAYCLAPYLVFAGTPIRPADLHRVVLTRPIGVPLTIWRTLRAPRTRWELDLLRRREEARAWYNEQIEAGVERYLGERRVDCPWCGSRDLVRHLVTRDILFAKPGRFPLERCRGCRHVFQNPQVTPEGLDFYYRDAYDGLGAQTTEMILASTTSDYLARAHMVEPYNAAPGGWLDIGTGKGHFPRAGRTVLPGTVFDGLDMGDGVEEAARRGWIGRAYRGQFVDIGTDMIGRYDVLSMNHYLEHTTDPPAELDLAAKILEPGGLFLLEMPDPESVFAKLLRGFYLPYLPPQHLHLIPEGNLRTALEARGMEVLVVHRREARRGGDLGGAAASLINQIGVDVESPWRSPNPPGAGWYARSIAGQLVGIPLFASAILLDLAMLPFLRGRSNTYRILARKLPDPDGS